MRALKIDTQVENQKHPASGVHETDVGVGSGLFGINFQFSWNL